MKKKTKKQNTKPIGFRFSLTCWEGWDSGKRKGVESGVSIRQAEAPERVGIELHQRKIDEPGWYNTASPDPPTHPPFPSSVLGGGGCRRAARKGQFQQRLLRGGRNKTCGSKSGQADSTFQRASPDLCGRLRGSHGRPICPRAAGSRGAGGTRPELHGSPGPARCRLCAPSLARGEPAARTMKAGSAAGGRQGLSPRPRRPDERPHGLSPENANK